MKSRHCRHCGDRRDKMRPSLHRWKLERLLVDVRSIIQPLASGASITAEEIATKLRARKPMVEQCFHRLNLEGILSQGRNRPPHDSSRDPWHWGSGDSAWCANYLRANLTQ